MLIAIPQVRSPDSAQAPGCTKGASRHPDGVPIRALVFRSRFAPFDRAARFRCEPRAFCPAMPRGGKQKAPPLWAAGASD